MKVRVAGFCTNSTKSGHSCTQDMVEKLERENIELESDIDKIKREHTSLVR